MRKVDLPFSSSYVYSYDCEITGCGPHFVFDCQKLTSALGSALMMQVRVAPPPGQAWTTRSEEVTSGGSGIYI